MLPASPEGFRRFRRWRHTLERLEVGFIVRLGLDHLGLPLGRFEREPGVTLGDHPSGALIHLFIQWVTIGPRNMARRRGEYEQWPLLVAFDRPARQAVGIAEQKLREGDVLRIDRPLVFPHRPEREAAAVAVAVNLPGALDRLVVEAKPVLEGLRDVLADHGVGHCGRRDRA